MVNTPIYKIIWDTNALYHLKEILIYLEKQSSRAPKIVKSEIIKRLELIKTNPLVFEIDRLKEPKNKNYRAFVVFSYRISYKINSNTNEILILRIRHTSREPLGY